MKKWMKYLAFYIAGLLTLFVASAIYTAISSLYDGLDEMVADIDVNIVALILTALTVIVVVIVIFYLLKKLQEMLRSDSTATITETSDDEDDTSSSAPLGKKRIDRVDRVIDDPKYKTDTAS
jgi:predicted PurR-regulated permease PerM